MVAVATGAALVVAGFSIGGDAAGADIAAVPVVETVTAAEPALVAVSATSELETTLWDASDVGAAVVPSVVTIQISGTFRNQEVVVGSGSGVIYDLDGHIVTNAHVVEAGEGFEVVLSDGRVYQAEVVGVDTATDLAVLDIDADDLNPVVLGSTDVLEVGDPAIAVGSPLGLDGGPSLTVGVVSAFDRLVQIDDATVMFGMLQADAPITQGSSGGALVDGEGRLIGITSAVGVSDIGIEGIGFSTPVEIVTRVVDELITTGYASEPFIGITGSTASIAVGSVPE